MRGQDAVPNRYDDMLCMPHHVSQTRPHMPRADRAAQFAPFAALTGFDTVVDETARSAEEKAFREETEPFDAAHSDPFPVIDSAEQFQG